VVALLLLLASLFLGGASKTAPSVGRQPPGPRAANDDVIEGDFRRVD
jgi:hypothetical protein